ncbi:MAG: MBL fold metallo-hydrolase [Phycisphaera sp.]|nr:MBL fold metallo-hydrolase [Phycisphaera sp.]
MIKPLRKDDELLDDIRATDTGDGYALWWLGQSGFLVKHRGRFLLFDPYLSDALSKKYATTDKPHVRMTELVIDPARLDFIDVVTSTHNHTDHLDGETLAALRRVNPDMKLIIPEANRAFVAERLGCDTDWPIGLVDGASAEVAGFTIHAAPAAHEALDTDDQGRHVYLGYVVEFGAGDNRYAIYHSGDTVLYDGIVERLRKFDIDVALLPINGALPERRVSGNLWGDEAARLAHDIGARCVVPCHFEMFEFNTETPERFVAACDAIGQSYAVLPNGGRLVVNDALHVE